MQWIGSEETKGHESLPCSSYFGQPDKMTTEEWLMIDQTKRQNNLGEEMWTRGPQKTGVDDWTARLMEAINQSNGRQAGRMSLGATRNWRHDAAAEV